MTWLVVVLVLLFQLGAINVAFGEGRLFFYQGIVGPSSVVISLLTACLAANIGVLVSLRAPSTRQAQQTLSIATMALFVIPILGLRVIPDPWRAELSNILSAGGINSIIIGVMVFLLILNSFLFIITLTQFRRTRRILSM